MQYLNAEGYHHAEEMFAEECGLTLGDYPEKKNLLAQKWRSLAKLQREKKEMEQKIVQLKDSLNPADTIEIGGKARDGLPKHEKFECKGHSDRITGLAFHPIQEFLVSSSDDGRIKIWDSETGDNEKTLTGHSGNVRQIAFSPDGSTLASASRDTTVKLWSLTKFTCFKTLKGHDHQVTGVAYTPNGDHVLSCSWDGTIRVWEASTGLCVKTLNGHEHRILDLDVSYDSKWIISCGDKADIMFWNTDFSTSSNNIEAYFEKEHEHQIDTIVFANYEGAKCITRMIRDKQQQLANGHNSEAGPQEDDEEEKKEQAEAVPQTALERMKAKKEALKKKMAKARGGKTEDEEDKEETEVVVKHSFVASGS